MRRSHNSPRLTGECRGELVRIVIGTVVIETSFRMVHVGWHTRRSTTTEGGMLLAWGQSGWMIWVGMSRIVKACRASNRHDGR